MAEPKPAASIDDGSIDGVDLAALEAWMDDHGVGSGPITDPKPLAGGTQNIIIGFARGGDSYVLRRPPLHKRANSDETMRREARVLSALAGSAVPHPRLIAAEADPSVLGAAFTLTAFVDGFNPTVGLPSPHRDDPAIRHRIGLSLVEAAAALASIDHLGAGLGDLGRPDGFLERQVPRWRAQLESYAELDGYDGPAIGEVDVVADWLDRNRPAAGVAGIMHGDFHLANVLVSRDAGEIAAVVDWELCTIGDPLLDLGWVLATWRDDVSVMTTTAVEPWDGFATPAELIAHYAAHTDRPIDDWPWFATLACYKLGIILEGTHARACAGLAPVATGDALHAMAIALFERAGRFMAAD
ncbi:MAG: phosphotransferase family protein [Acidimicrobiales bacterium]